MAVPGNPAEQSGSPTAAKAPRLIVLGASNVAKSLGVLVQVAEQRFGEPLEIVTATGRGRSYGNASWFLVRSLPSILTCEVWDHLTQHPNPNSHVVITDVGNDLLYAFTAEQIAQWVEQCVIRLKQHTCRIVLTGLPIHNVKRISPTKFLLFRTLFFPRTKIPLEEVQANALRLHDHLRGLAARYEIHFVTVQEPWYSVDPIHWKISARPEVWNTFLTPLSLGNYDPSLVISKLSTELSYLFYRQKTYTVCGVTRATSQPSVRLKSGTTIAIY
ncbi:MAG: hypothetical protein WDZ51_14455 [Pirellulaceae bacterium]